MDRDIELARTDRPLDVSAAVAQHRDRWELSDAAVVEIGSYADENFAVRAPAGRYALKHEHRTASALDREHGLMAALAAACPDLRVPTPVSARDGRVTQALADGSHLRLLTWVEGTVLHELPDLDDGALRALGALAGRVDGALAGLATRGAVTDSRWDPRHAPATVAAVLDDGDHPPSAAEAAALRAAIAPLTAEAAASAASGLPLQLIHGDITDHNTLAARGSSHPTGLIDFGDACLSWRISDLAAAAVAVACRRPDDALEAIVEVVTGYQDSAPLTSAEVELLWPLILARAALCAGLSVRQRRLSPSSAYVAAMDAADWAGVRTLLAVPTGLGPAAIRVACGLSPVGAVRPRSATPIPVVGDPPDLVLDLGVDSAHLHDGAWADPVALTAAVGEQPALGRWGEVRLGPDGPADAAPPTLHLGVDVFCAPGTAVRAPLAATVTGLRDAELWLALEQGPAAHLRLAGLVGAVSAGPVAAGTTLGHVAARDDGGPPHLHVQLAAAPDAPPRGSPRLREAWLSVCPDPSDLVGTDVHAAAPLDTLAERARRERVLASAQELYYRSPLQTVRGWRQYLYDESGRPFLDMVNNVASIGHSHPRVAAAAARQLRLLNTNSRFLYESMTDYAERLAALAPAPLDTVFLVNSGSEACDLALQITRAATARHDIVALQGAYHGWTGAVYEACSSPADNPGWERTKPPWVHLADQPDPYRGRFGDDGAAYARSVADACERAAQRSGDGGPAAFISEPMLGNQGAVELPAGYLAAAYDAVRARGGLCIADEIQVGYGRTGETFWAFEHEGVVPDVLVTAKAAGNGHPIGAVICSRGLADALGARAAFFSSTGGGPVSCEVGIAVLDVIADERLRENARTVGARLARALRGLAGEHVPIGAVHGRGLYLGVDLVRDRETRLPDRARSLAVCERMRRLGIVVQPTGDAGNVLKVKPPLCITMADADRFVATLDRALRDVAAWL